MGKIIDFLLTNDWQEFQKVQLMKKLGKTLDSLSPQQIQKIKKVLKEED